MKTRLKVCIVIFLLVLLSSFMFLYWWFSIMEVRTYSRKTPVEFCDTLLLYDFFDTSDFHTRYTLPIKTEIHENLYNYWLNFEIYSDKYEKIIIHDITLFLPDNQQLNLLDSDMIINYYRVFTESEIDDFKKNRVIQIQNNISSEENTYLLKFKNISIPFKRVKDFTIRIALSVEDVMGTITTKTLLSEYTQKITKLTISPSV